MDDRWKFVEQIRGLETDPVLREVYAGAAADVVTAAVSDADPAKVWDDDYLELDEENRSAYVTAQAETLAPALQRAGLVWALFECESVAAWQDRVKPT